MNERFYKLFGEKNALQRYIARRFLFNLFQRIGFHVTGNHFYEVVPDTRALAASYHDTPRELGSINWRFAPTEANSVRLMKNHGLEYKGDRHQFGFHESNYYFRGLDSLMLYAFVRDLKPTRMIEIGQGYSTRITLSALQRNAQETGTQCELISIDPHNRFSENQVPKGVTLRLVSQELQTVHMEPLLEKCTFLFVDSSHVYKSGSDVEFEFTKIYPRLAPRTFLHIHDIFSPYDYPLHWMVKFKQFWNEQYFLEMFLMFNQEFEVAVPLQLLMRQSKVFMETVRGLDLGPDFQMTGQSCYLHRK